MGYLLVNPHSGNGGADELVAAAAARGIETRVLRDGDDGRELARAADAEALGMAGGDGSLAAVAAVAIERDLPFVCIPFGTRNHFARDVGIPVDDPATALSAFTDGAEQRVDVGRLEDRVFLNNVSFGVYAHLVHRREHHRRRREALARVRALGEVVRHRHEVGLSLDGRPVSARVVLVSNNAYDLDVLSIGERRRLDEGLLHVYTSTGLVRAGWQELARERLTVDAPGGSLRAAVDGEPVELATPIKLEVQPRALRMLVPRRESERIAS